MINIRYSKDIQTKHFIRHHPTYKQENIKFVPFQAFTTESLLIPQKKQENIDAFIT